MMPSSTQKCEFQVKTVEVNLMATLLLICLMAIPLIKADCNCCHTQHNVTANHVKCISYSCEISVMPKYIFFCTYSCIKY